MILLSTQHCDKGQSDADESHKPQIIKDYNKTKGGVDMGDQMTRKYTCVRQTRRWPYRIFMEIIDMAALNAYIIWTGKYSEWNKNNKRKRKLFLQDLCLELVTPYVKRRLRSTEGLHRSTLRDIEALGISTKNFKFPSLYKKRISSIISQLLLVCYKLSGLFILSQRFHFL